MCEKKKKKKRAYRRERGDNKRDTRRKKMSSEVTTRVEELRVDERDDLWDVIVNNDDVCFEYILPRLNQTDIKFLYDVNTETRALIKRSSRKDELRTAFKVSEMSSISTLEVAWENQSFWGKCLNKRNFCTKVARTNKLELLKWAREEKQCKWDTETINVAAKQGDLEMVKYCVANRCPIDASAFINAAKNGHCECFKYLDEEGAMVVHVKKDEWDAFPFQSIGFYGNENKWCPLCDGRTVVRGGGSYVMFFSNEYLVSKTKEILIERFENSREINIQQVNKVLGYYFEEKLKTGPNPGIKNFNTVCRQREEVCYHCWKKLCEWLKR